MTIINKVLFLIAISFSFSVVSNVSFAAPLSGQIMLDPKGAEWFVYNRDLNNDGKLDPYFLAGPGDPEDFLYRGSLNADGTRSGDQVNIINKLAGTGANSLYIQMIRSHGGDGNHTHNPFINHDPDAGLNDALLNQWESWFSLMDSAGITIFLIFYDDSARIWNSGDSVSSDEQNFFEAMVARFKHHKHLIWVIAEEYNESYSSKRISNLASVVRQADEHKHPIAVHKLEDLRFSEFENDPNINQFALQYNAANTDVDAYRRAAEDAWENAAGKYNLNFAETIGHKYMDRDSIRYLNWSLAMAGSYVMAYTKDVATTDIEELNDLGRMRQFFENTNFNEMLPANHLASGDTQQVLAQEGVSYILYSGNVNSKLGLAGLTAGNYQLKWLDVEKGTNYTETKNLSGGAQLFNSPQGFGRELALFIQRVAGGENVAPSAQSQSISVVSGGTINIDLSYSDFDGPGPYAFTVLSYPQNGLLNGSGSSYSYVANEGFAGTDTFTFEVSDSQLTSQPATVTINVLEPQSEGELVNDNFERNSGDSLGNGWVEWEPSGTEIVLSNGKLLFETTSDASNSPTASIDFSPQIAGQFSAEFDFDWRRSGDEGVYELWMQLGNSNSGSTAVNLLWSTLNNNHETLAYVSGGQAYGLGQISGQNKIKIVVDKDMSTYKVEVNGQTIGSALPLNSSEDIDQIRFYTNGVNHVNFTGRSFDNVIVSGNTETPPPPANQAPVALDMSFETGPSQVVTMQLGVLDPDGPGPYTFTIVNGPQNGQLSGVGNDRSYKPDCGFEGVDRFQYIVNDGEADSELGEVIITVQ